MPTRHDVTPAVPRKILLIKLRHHGDMILTTPVINNLRQHYPAAEIDVLLYKETAPILAHHPAITHIHVIVTIHQGRIDSECDDHPLI